MNSTRFSIFACLVVSLCLAIWAVTFRRESSEARKMLHAAQAQRHRIALEIGKQREQLKTIKAALERSETEVDSELRKATAITRQASQKTQAKELAISKLKEARAAAAQGRHKDALETYLWCLDTAMRDPSQRGREWRKLLKELLALGKSYLPALHALQSRRDREEADFIADAKASPESIVTMNALLGMGAETIALFDKLPPDDPRRSQLVQRGYDDFVAARRYADCNRFVPASKVSVGVEAALGMIGESQKQSVDQIAMTNQKQIPQLNELVNHVLGPQLRQLESLSAGDNTEKVRYLANKVLTTIPGADTRKRLHDAFQRAGNTQLASEFAAP